MLWDQVLILPLASCLSAASYVIDLPAHGTQNLGCGSFHMWSVASHCCRVSDGSLLTGPADTIDRCLTRRASRTANFS
eukprot:5336731-Pleurochrysis_carterae.AAC.1